MRTKSIAVLVALVLCSTAAADLHVNISTSGGSWPQAPYIIAPTEDQPDWMPDSFKTFCIERNVTFSPGNYRATIDDDIQYAYPGSTTPLALEESVKKIYAAFLNDQLTAFTGTQIQYSVWGAQGYSGYSVNSGINTIIGNAAATTGWEGVKALNLWGTNGQDIQSQLVMTPVPVPGAELLGVLGLSFASLRLRRRKCTA